MSAVSVQDRGRVRIIYLDRPERRNALNVDDRLSLIEALRLADEQAGAIVLAGTGGTFSAGGDIHGMSQDPAKARHGLDVINTLARHLIAGKLPVVAAVEGGAYGLGLALVAGSDIAVAGRSALFSTAFAKIGLSSDTGLAYTLPLRVGRARARKLLLMSPTFDADEAERLGVIDLVVDDATALDSAIDVATRLAELSAPMVAGLRRILLQPDQSLEGILEAEAALQVELLTGPNFTEGRAAFLERRRPKFR